MQRFEIEEFASDYRVKVSALLLGIFLIAFSARYITAHELLFDPDSYWWYQLALYFAGIDAGHLQYFYQEDGKILYELRYYPTSKPIEKGLLLLPMSIGYSYKILGAFGAPQTAQGMLKHMFFFGPFFGALTAVLAYFLGRELTGSHKAGFIAAIFYSFSHFAMTRNTAGDTGQESLGTFLLFLMLYLFIASTRARDLKLNAGYAAASGAVFLLAANTWGGTSFYWGLIVSSVFAYLVIKAVLNHPLKEYRSIAVAFPILIAVGVLLPAVTGVGNSYVIGPISTANQFQNFSYLTVLLCLFLIGYSKLREAGKFSIQPRVVFLAVIAAGVLGLLVTGKFAIIERIFDFIHKLVFTPEEKGLTGKTVAYYRSTGFTEFKNTFNILLLAIPAGFALIGYDFYRKRDFSLLFMLIFMLLGIVAFRYMIRLSYFLAFILPLFIGVLYTRYMERQSRKAGKNPKKGKAPSAGMKKLGMALAPILLLVLIAPTLVSGISLLKSEKMADGGVVPWKDAGEWISKNTPKNALLIHWWDYGYHLQTFAKRRTIVDGGNTGPKITGNSRNVDVANAFTSSEEEFYSYIKPYNPENLPVYVLVSYAEFGKSGAINFHARDNLWFNSLSFEKSGSPQADQERISNFLKERNLTNYYLVDAGGRYVLWVQRLSDQQGNYHPEWQNKVLPKLLPTSNGLGRGMEHFELVYQNGYVYVYRYIP